jgi:hypothetical protein
VQGILVKLVFAELWALMDELYYFFYMGLSALVVELDALVIDRKSHDESIQK